MTVVTPTPPAVEPPKTPAGDVIVDSNGVVKVPDVTPPTPPAVPERPEGLPEKFATVGDMIKAYGELETKLSGTPPATPPAPTPPATPPAPPPVNPPTPAADIAKTLDLKPADLGQELLANNGAFSTETYAKFEGAGISKDVVNAYISGQQALADAQTARVHAMVGGEEKFTAMKEWAKTGLRAEEVVAFDATMASGDEAAISLAVAGIRATYEAQYGIDPSLLTGTAPRTAGAEPYLSLEDMHEAQSDPRYKVSPKYRGEVAARIGVSNLWG